MNFVFSVTISIVSITAVVADTKGCSFSLQKHTPKTPLILKNQKNMEVLYPNAYNVIIVSKDAKIKLSCVDKKFKKYNEKELIATCVKNDIVLVKNKETKFKLLECQSFPTSKIRINETKNCYQNNTLIEIGFLEKGQFLKTMVACFDKNESRSIYTWYNSSFLHTGHVSKVNRPFFLHDNLYTFNVSKMYNGNYQRERLKKILKSEELAKKYVKNDGKHFMSRGHLTPKADFVHGFEQASTFHYINAAPQWQIFNEGNWNNVESNVRDLLIKTKDRYGIITGTHDVMTLPDKDKVQREIYLYENQHNVTRLPVPRFYWKIVYDKFTKTGQTIIGINNPHLETIPKDYFLCKNICNRVKWLKLKKNDIKEGYVYCCRMRPFLKATGYENAFEELSEFLKL